MTVSAAQIANPSLVVPPKVATPDQAPIPGSAPPAGAGSITPPAVPPAGDGITPVLPFGNGATPAGSISAANLPAPIGDPSISNPGMIPFAGIQPLGGPGGDPFGAVPALPAPAGSASPNVNLQNTAILSDPNAPSISDSTAALAAKFGNAPAAVSGVAAPGAISAGVAPGDRTAMLSSLLNNFDTQQAARDNTSVTALGRSDAALGRLGSGMTSQAIDQIGRQSAADKVQYRDQLAQDTIDKQIADAQQQQGFNYGVNRDNQAAATAAGEFNSGVSRGNQQAGTAAQQWASTFGNNVAGQNYDQSQNALAALKGERAYQDTTAQNTIDNSANAAKLKEQFGNDAFSQALAQFQAGNVNNPTSVYQGAAGDLSGQSNQTMAALAQYLQSLGYNQQQKAA